MDGFHSINDHATEPQQREDQKQMSMTLAPESRASAGGKKRSLLTLGRSNEAPVNENETPVTQLPDAETTDLQTPAVAQPEPEKIAWKPSNPVFISHDELKAMVKELNCSVMTVAHFFNASERTGRRWWSGNLLVPPAVACLLRCALLASKDKPYREIAAAFQREAELLNKWEDEREARAAKKAAKAAKEAKKSV